MIAAASQSSSAARTVLFAIDVGGDGVVPGFGVLARYVVASLVFALLGIVVFGLAFWVLTKLIPFSIRKEIEDDQNTALGIVIGAVIIGLSMIISSAIQG